MKVVALVSGGKDSCFAMMKAIEYGHEIVALANLLPADDAVDELDSYMYQTVGHQIVVSYAKCMGLPLFRRRLQGTSRHQDLTYKMTPGDEVEDLFILLNEIKQQIPSVTAVSSGAIASDYQRLRVESVCSRLGLVSLAYLWKQDQRLLLEEMVKNGIRAILVKVAAIGLDPAKHLGKDIADMEPHFHHLSDLYGSNICGEGGEYETLTLDCPLFKYAQIVLDDFRVVLHSPDSIAPVGVLHPLAFHLEAKGLATSSGDVFCSEEKDIVCEVQGNCQQIHVNISESAELASHVTKTIANEVRLSRKDSADGTFSLSGWLPNSSQMSSGLQDDMKGILWKIESHLREHDFRWENVLYVHLYIADMGKFAAANETYVSFITQERCPFGVPSRSTIELPLLQVGLGEACIEVLVARDLTKKVLHVQSISCWAPSCIGPYSQATLYKGILHMAGQLGLDPPTMTLCKGGPTAELEQALLNSEAVARSFNCSISTSTVLFTIYCSTDIDLPERAKVQEKLKNFLERLQTLYPNKQNCSGVLDPVIVYVLVPALPKRAFVEVKPLLHVTDGAESTESVEQDGYDVTNQSYWGFQDEDWHRSCMDKCIVEDEVLVAVLCITEEIFLKMGQDCPEIDQTNGSCQSASTENLMAKVVKLCIYLLDKELVQNSFSWQDATHLRIYFRSSLPVAMEKLSLTFTNACHEFAEMNHMFKSNHMPIFNLIPVLRCGRSAASMDSLITCELLAQRNHKAH